MVILKMMRISPFLINIYVFKLNQQYYLLKVLDVESEIDESRMILRFLVGAVGEMKLPY